MIIRHFPQQCSAQVSQVLYHLSQWQCVSIDLELPVTVTSGIIYYMFSRESGTKPSFAIVTGWGSHPLYLFI